MTLDWRNLPPLTALRAFDATARHGGFAEAARSLNVTHAAVAQQVRGLEAHLGLSLAVRQGRNVVFTDASQQLARTLGESFHGIALGVEKRKDANANRALRVTTTPFLTERLIMPRLAEFWAAHPGAEISISRTRTYADIIGEGFDLAIRSLIDFQVRGQPGPGIDREPVSDSTLTGIVAPSLLAKTGPDVKDLPWVRHDVMDPKAEIMSRCGIPVDTVKQVRVGSTNLLLEAVRQGLGATIFNEPIARDEIKARGIVELPLPRPSHITYHALTPKGQKHPLVRPFVDWVRSLF
ncbi:MAG: LysR substrate-binding domain-containing protein [Rhodobacteraceae bacterium]|nr:LysR substrate-binding domain-containing protein [Paracoccaceae bacterium]